MDNKKTSTSNSDLQYDTRRISVYMRAINNPNTCEEGIKIFSQWITAERKNNFNDYSWVKSSREAIGITSNPEDEEWHDYVKKLAPMIKSCKLPEGVHDIFIQKTYKLSPECSSETLADEMSKDLATLGNK